jgi:hypothetical protein
VCGGNLVLFVFTFQPSRGVTCSRNQVYNKGTTSTYILVINVFGVKANDATGADNCTQMWEISMFTKGLRSMCNGDYYHTKRCVYHDMGTLGTILRE